MKVFEQPMLNKVWDKKFPGWREKVIETFGTDDLSTSDIAVWKNKWIEKEKYTAIYSAEELGIFHILMLRKRFEGVCLMCNIHPYFIDITAHKRDVRPHPQHIDKFVVSFYYEEDLTLFKLSGGLHDT